MATYAHRRRAMNNSGWCGVWARRNEALFAEEANATPTLTAPVAAIPIPEAAATSRMPARGKTATPQQGATTNHHRTPSQKTTSDRNGNFDTTAPTDYQQPPLCCTNGKNICDEQWQWRRQPTRENTTTTTAKTKPIGGGGKRPRPRARGSAAARTTHATC